MTPLARDLSQRGFTAVNVEYRRVGGAGGWPETFEDVAAAIDLLVEDAEIDPDRVAVVGHSAGGHLALWAAGRHRLPAGAPGAGPRLRPCAAVSQAGVADLSAAADAHLGGGAVRDLLGGGPDAVPERYAVADPARLVPLGVPTLLVHGAGDDLVPPSQSRTYAGRARAAGDEVELVLDAGDHLSHLDPGHPLWHAVVDRLPRLCPP